MLQKEKARRLSGTPLILFPTPAEPTTIEPISPPADALAVGIPPATGTHDNRGAIVAIASAIIAPTTAIEATASPAIDAAATIVASSAARLR